MATCHGRLSRLGSLPDWLQKERWDGCLLDKAAAAHIFGADDVHYMAEVCACCNLIRPTNPSSSLAYSALLQEWGRGQLIMTA
jgi:hypothetical protein